MLFYADHDLKTDLAVQLALGELDVRKDIYGYDAAAWALYRDGRVEEAAPLIEQALRLGTRDARLFYHAGMIEHELGRREQARAYLEEALDLNPEFSLLQAAEARQVLGQLSGGEELAEAGN